MELTFIWSWFSFIVGVFAALGIAFWLVVGFAFKQWKKQRDANKTFSFEDIRNPNTF